jgi:hypothetical protein
VGFNKPKERDSIRRRFAITYVVPKYLDSVSYLLIEGGKHGCWFR